MLSYGPRAKRQFRYENVWQTHPDYDRLVCDTWRGIQHTPGLQGIASALGSLQSILEPWGSKEFGCLARTVRKLQKRLDRIRCSTMGVGPTDEEKSTVKKLKEALYQEEVWLRQRSRVPWLLEGNRNTSYFQAQAAQRKRMNKIHGLRRADGTICETEREGKACWGT